LKIRKFFAGSSREALRLVREALGPDAVVLSNRAIDGGVELVALAENDLATLAQPGSPTESAGEVDHASYAPMAPVPRAPQRAAGLPDPFASTFGAPAASVDNPSNYPSGSASVRPPPRPTWDEQHTSGAAASYEGRTPAPQPARKPPENNHAVDHVVDRAVERSLRQQSERIAAWRAESAAVSRPYDARSGDLRADSHGEIRGDTQPVARSQASASPEPAQFTQHTPDPHDQIVRAAVQQVTPATAMARNMGAPSTALPNHENVHGNTNNHADDNANRGASRSEAAYVAPQATAMPFAVPPAVRPPPVAAAQDVALTLPDSAAAFAVPPIRSYPAVATLPQPAYTMRTTVTASMISRFPAPPQAEQAVVADAAPAQPSIAAAEPAQSPSSVAPDETVVAKSAVAPAAAAAAPAAELPTPPSVAPAAQADAASHAAGPHDLADQLANEPVFEAQARVAELVAQSVIGEIHSMRGVIEEQLAGLLWSDRQRRDPARGQAAKTLLAAGFSAQLVKLLIERMPTQLDHAHAMEWLKAALGRNLPVLQNEDELLERGGVYALMGPTGVGKTTTTAKLAARCVMRYGANRVALLTTDSYRIGAHEQLRIYGKILGVGVHAVKDAADLRLALSELRNKHMVLIDTIGMSQRDRTVSEQVAMLCGTGTPVQRLLLLNATSHGDTLNEVVHAYRNRQAAEGHSDLAGCILTKLDEATNIGAVLDTVIRYRLPVHYVSTGQKVPENLYVARKDFLMESAFAVSRENSPFAPADDELAAIMAAAPTRASADLSEVRLG